MGQGGVTCPNVAVLSSHGDFFLFVRVYRLSFFREFGTPVAIANLSVFVIAGLYASYRYKTGKVHIVTAGSIEEISD